MLLKVDLNGSWAEISEILIVTHKLPTEKYVFDRNRFRFRNFADVPTLADMKLKNNVTYVYFTSD